jgi:luciferase family oxidoreductase group 1
VASPFTISVLDQSPVPEGSSGPEALRNTVDLARLAESLRYERYWVAEHHATPMLACASPEVVIAAVAAETSSIRVGSGGVMLPHYSALKVAETFSVLSGLYPGRIDLGIGRAPGTDHHTMLALQRDRRLPAPDDFPEQLAELLAYYEDGFPPRHPLARLADLPGRPERPEVWLLGSSRQSAIWAAELGLPYSFADFINPEGAGHAGLYRSRFAPTHRSAEPRVAVAVSAICAETDEEADRLAASLRMAITLLHQGRLIQVPRPEEAERWLTAQGLGNRMPPGRRAVVGSPATVRAGLEQVAEEYGASEVQVVTITHDHTARRRSYELIAEAFELAPAMAELGREGPSAAAPR